MSESESDTGNSNKSYEKIYRALLATADGQAFMAKIKAAYEGAVIVSHEFRLHQPGNGAKPEALVMFKTSFCGDTFSSPECNPRYVLLPEKLYGERDSTRIVEDNFPDPSKGVKTGVPTFFCKKETVLKGSDGAKGDANKAKRGRVKQKSFYSWLEDHLNETFESLRTSATDRIQKQAQAMLEDEAFKTRRQEALVRFALDEVSKVMTRFSFLGIDVLKDGIREFSVMEVLES